MTTRMATATTRKEKSAEEKAADEKVDDEKLMKAWHFLQAGTPPPTDGALLDLPAGVKSMTTSDKNASWYDGASSLRGERCPRSSST